MRFALALSLRPLYWAACRRADVLATIRERSQPDNPDDCLSGFETLCVILCEAANSLIVAKMIIELNRNNLIQWSLIRCSK